MNHLVLLRQHRRHSANRLRIFNASKSLAKQVSDVGRYSSCRHRCAEQEETFHRCLALETKMLLANAIIAPQVASDSPPLVTRHVY